jgi:hypothetical protein
MPWLNNDFDEIASSHCLRQGRDYAEQEAITAGIGDRRNGINNPESRMSALGHFRPIQPVLPAGPFRFAPESGLEAGRSESRAY